jgi:hypothetical protein
MTDSPERAAARAPGNPAKHNKRDSKYIEMTEDIDYL